MASAKSPLTPPRDLQELRQMIASGQVVVHPKSRRVLEFALAHPEVIALDSIADIAARSGSATTTVYRIGELFGFGSFQELRKLFQCTVIEMSRQKDAFTRRMRTAQYG